MEFENFGNGAVREDKTGKGRFDLLPWCAIMRVAKHMQESLKVYSPRNWEQGLPMHSMVDSAFRHLAKYTDGWKDEDHLCAAATNLLMAMWMEEKKPEMQDIPTRINDELTEDEKAYSEEAFIERELDRCDFYDSTLARCMGTKDMERCNCNGITSCCDFYEEFRSGKPRQKT